MSRTPAGSCARNQGTRPPGAGRDPGENCGLSRPAQLARSCTASRGYARGSSMRGYARGSSMRGYARGSSMRGYARGSSMRGYARGSSMRGYARGKIIDAWHDPGAGAAHPAPHHGPGSRGPERSRARRKVTHARRVVHAADWATRASDYVVHAERDSGGNSKLETAAPDRWRQPSPLAGPAYRSGPGPSKLLSLGTRASRRRDRLT